MVAFEMIDVLSQCAARVSNLAGRQVYPPASRNRNEYGPLSLRLAWPAIYRFLILSDSFVGLRPFSDFSSAMTLAMTLDANHSGVLCV